MPGLVPGIHVLDARKTWLAGTRAARGPAMTVGMHLRSHQHTHLLVLAAGGSARVMNLPWLPENKGKQSAVRRRWTECESVRWRVLRCRRSPLRTGSDPGMPGPALHSAPLRRLNRPWHPSRLTRTERRHFGRALLRQATEDHPEAFAQEVTPRCPGTHGCELHVQAPLLSPCQTAPCRAPLRGTDGLL